MMGLAPLEAADLSEDMLGVAATKGVYARCFAGDLLARLPVEDAAYGGAVSSGTFTHGHVGPEALTEVLRIVRPGGVVALSINAEHWQAKGFSAHFDRLSSRITDLETRDVGIYGPKGTGAHANDKSRVVTFRRF
jgi:SAM-dependent methyltransferase